MSGTLVVPADLATILNDSNINTDRATELISEAQALCESIVSPLPATAAVVIKRMAARAYLTSGQSRGQEFAGMVNPAGSVTTGTGGVYLWPSDRADLRRLAGGGGAFSINMLPADYALPSLPVWDVQSAEVDVSTS